MPRSIPAIPLASVFVRWATRGRARAPAPVPALHHRHQRIEQARSQMLRLVEGSALDRAHVVRRRIRLAEGLDQLWYLRCDLLATIADAHGEAVARQRVQQLDPLFDDVR